MKPELVRHFEDRVANASAGDMLYEVGKTVNGRSVPAAQLGLEATAIREALDLQRGDKCLDVGCGNGVLTLRVAAHCGPVTALEPVPGLYRSAVRHHAADSVRYVNTAVEDFTDEGGYAKAWLYEVLQYVDYGGFEPLLRKLQGLMVPGGRVFIGGVPDIERKWNFYDTPERRAYLFDRLVRGQELMDIWWHRDFIATAARRGGWDCEFREQAPQLYTSHYRFDALLKKK